jgi:hypothetical protein
MDITVPERRVREIPMYADFLVAFMRSFDGTPKRIACQGIPADARVVGVRTDSAYPHRLYIQIESAEFAALPEGADAPWLEPEFIESLGPVRECTCMGQVMLNYLASI